MTFDWDPENETAAQEYVCSIVYASLESNTCIATLAGRIILAKFIELEGMLFK